ncbi:MAG TPA: hypothetical protein VK168_17025 [Saprospiraceae bacterium]|nr:hypothetical protein [Saprospiraceae bacterium]
MPQRLLAAVLVILFGCIVFLYVREFRYLSSTIGVKWLVAGSMLVVAVLTSAGLWRWRDRFTPLDRHLPEVLLISVFSVLFAPLWGSLINRALGKETHRSFIFESETAYYASGYGILKGEKLKPTGWKLRVNDGGVSRLFTYKSQSYYPLSKPGDVILLPITKGLFGFEVIELK